MKFTETNTEKKQIFSLEIFPPKKNAGGIDTIYDTLDGLKARFYKCNLWCWWKPC